MPQFAASIIHIHVFQRHSSRPLYLLLQHHASTATSGRPGHWSVLEGRIGDGETAVDAGLRLLGEQTGLPAKQLWGLNYLNTFFDPFSDTIHLIPTLVVEIQDAPPTLSTAYAAHRWVTFDQALDMIKHSGVREGLRHAHEDVVNVYVRGGDQAAQAYDAH